MRPLYLLFIFVALGACASTDSRTSASVRLWLESVRLNGSRICDNQASTPERIVAGCPSLPTAAPSAWLLTPAWEPVAGNAQHLRANRTVVLNVRGPSGSEVDVELVRGNGQLNLPLELVESGIAGAPGEVTAWRQAGITTIDDGSATMWMIEVVVSTCSASRHLQIFNRSSKSAERSQPLEIALVRNDKERLCIPQPGEPAPRFGIGDPVNQRAAGGCAGGGTGKMFEVCESCPGLYPEGLRVYFAGRYCTWDEVLSVHGYAGDGAVKSRLCTLSQVGSREACEGK
jgi:hypothetical protein